MARIVLIIVVSLLYSHIEVLFSVFTVCLFSFLWLGYMRGLHNCLRGSVNGDQLSLLDLGKGPSLASQDRKRKKESSVQGAKVFIYNKDSSTIMASYSVPST